MVVVLGRWRIFLPAGIQLYGIEHKPVIDVDNNDRPTVWFKNKLNRAITAVVDFQNHHPVLTGIAKVVGEAALSTLIYKLVDDSRSKPDHSNPNNHKYTPSKSDSFIDSNDEAQFDAVDTDISTKHSPPEEHMVKGHGQHYHYKDGSVRWKEKDPYPRGGNNDD